MIILIYPDNLAILLTDENWLLLAFNIRASKLFGINPAQVNLRKYINSEEKISTQKLIPELEKVSFVQTTEASGINEVDLNLKIIHKLIGNEIEIHASPEENDILEEQKEDYHDLYKQLEYINIVKN